MHKKIEYKPIEEKDLPDVKSIYDWYIENSKATFHTEPISIDELKEFVYINHQAYKAFLIFFESKPAGYCLLTHLKKRQAYNRTAEITIYLNNDIRGNGIGKQALSYLEGLAQKAGLKNLIGLITRSNNASITLFEKLGYFKCAHYKNVGEKFGRILDVVAYQKEI